MKFKPREITNYSVSPTKEVGWFGTVNSILLLFVVEPNSVVSSDSKGTHNKGALCTPDQFNTGKINSVFYIHIADYLYSKEVD